MTVVNEPGLYTLILSSRKPEAKAFKRWITHEVIPTIRKTGGYMTGSLLERIQKELVVIMEFAQALIREKNRSKVLEGELNTAKPKADYYDAFINPDDCTNIRTTAKELKIPERKFVHFLLRGKYLFRSPSGQLLPYNKDNNAGLFIVRDFVTYCYTGSQTYFTPKSKDVIRVKSRKSTVKSCFPRWQGDPCGSLSREQESRLYGHGELPPPGQKPVTQGCRASLKDALIQQRLEVLNQGSFLQSARKVRMPSSLRSVSLRNTATSSGTGSETVKAG